MFTRKILCSCCFTLAALWLCLAVASPAFAQKRGEGDFLIDVPVLVEGPIREVINVRPPAPPPPPPPRFDPPVINIPPPVVRVPNTPPFSLDVTPINRQEPQAGLSPAGLGVHSVSPGSFPAQSNLKGSPDGFVVKYATGTDFGKPNPLVAVLNHGTILASVRRPSQGAMVDVPAIGSISLAPGADVISSYNDGVMRVQNLDGRGNSVMVKLDKGPFAGAKTMVLAVAPGYELVASDHLLTRSDIRPHDNVARRHFQSIGNGHIGVSEFSVESVIATSQVIAAMSQRDSGAKERNLVLNYSKMAAVLNHMNGAGGYTANR